MSAMPAVRMPPLETEYIVPGGGLDQVTPPMSLPNGMLREALNLQCSVEGGYSRIAGYERYVDGGIAGRQFQVMQLSNGDLPLLEVLIGDISGARCTVCCNTPSDQAGLTATQLSSPHTLSVGSSPYNVVVSNVEGVFVVGETVSAFYTLAPAVATVVTPPEPIGPSDTPKEFAQLVKQYQDAMRQKIAGTAGYFDLFQTDYAIGPVRAVTVFNDLVIVVREAGYDYATGTFSGSGSCQLWAMQQVGDFWPTLGVAAPGHTWFYWGPGLGTGYIPVSDDLKVRIIQHNFGGSTAQKKMFLVSGTAKALMITPSTATQITTGLSDDKPTHVAAHGERLFLGYKSSVLYSKVGDPTNFADSTAGEIALGDDITGMEQITGANSVQALLITTKRKTFMLYGVAEADMQLVPLAPTVGAYPDTIQNMGTLVITANEQGITNLGQTQKFGGFAQGTLTQRIKPFMVAHRGREVCSLVSRDRNQYRIYYDNGDALYITMRDDKVVGIAPVRLAFRPTCCYAGVLTDGSEIILLGSETGALYRMDVGTSFDGDPFYSYARMAFATLKSPRMLKTFKLGVIEVECDDYAEMNVNYDLGWGSPTIDVQPDQPVVGPTSNEGLNWDTTFWDKRWWDGRNVSPARVKLAGTGENISLLFHTISDHVGPYNISGIGIHYLMRRIKRGA